MYVHVFSHGLANDDNNVGLSRAQPKATVVQ